MWRQRPSRPGLQYTNWPITNSSSSMAALVAVAGGGRRGGGRGLGTSKPSATITDQPQALIMIVNTKQRASKFD